MDIEANNLQFSPMPVEKFIETYSGEVSALMKAGDVDSLLRAIHAHHSRLLDLYFEDGETYLLQKNGPGSIVWGTMEASTLTTPCKGIK